MNLINTLHDNWWNRWRIAPALAVLASAAIAFAPSHAARSADGTASEHPNILVVMTDDQDLASLAFMPHVQQLLASRGVTFTRHTVEYSLCCPSRSTYLSGQLSHNSHVRGQSAPNGGYGNLNSADTLPVWLQNVGYATQHVGKYPNGYGMESHPDTGGVPPGWTDWRTPIGAAGGVGDENVYEFYDYTFDENGILVPHGHLPSDYRDDVETGFADDFIRKQSALGKPFFVDLSYLAPHWEWVESNGVPDINREETMDGGSFEAIMNPPKHAPRHDAMFAGAEVPQMASFDEADVSDKPAFVQSRPRLSDDQRRRLNVWYRARLQSLQAVDEGVARLVETLGSLGQLDNTYIIFTADNGWMQGQHRLTFTKVHVYEPSTRIPLIIAGPGVSQGSVSDWTSNVDVPATIASLTHALPGHALDGMSLIPYLKRPSLNRGRVVLHNTSPDKAGYAAVRAGDWKYVEYATGERELYDLARDPDELENVVNDKRHQSLVAHLHQYLDRLSDCAGSGCVLTTR